MTACAAGRDDAGRDDAGRDGAGRDDAGAGESPLERIELPELDDTLTFGAAVGRQLQPGDLVLLSGDLGAGKTALTKGIAVGMGIADTITSPTFVLARVHRGRQTTLVHVDAYRLGGAMELDDLDLDTDLARAAVVIEWGEGIADQLASDPLHIKLTRHPDDARTAEITGSPRQLERFRSAARSSGSLHK